MSATLFDLPSAPVPDDTAALLELIAGDPIHDRDRAVIVRAVVAEAHSRGGRVDPNRLRARLCDENGDLTVYSRVVGATIHALVRAGVLIPDGWVTSTDRKGRNSGKPARQYRARIGVAA